MVGYRISMGLCGEGKGNPFEQFVSCVVHVLPPQPRKNFGETYFNQTFSSHICKMTFQHSITMESFRRTHVFAVPRRFFRWPRLRRGWRAGSSGQQQTRAVDICSLCLNRSYFQVHTVYLGRWFVFAPVRATTGREGHGPTTSIRCVIRPYFVTCKLYKKIAFPNPVMLPGCFNPATAAWKVWLAKNMYIVWLWFYRTGGTRTWTGNTKIMTSNKVVAKWCSRTKMKNCFMVGTRKRRVMSHHV